MYAEKIKQLVRGKKICIFPMGIAGKSLMDKLSNIGIEIDFFCDNNEKKCGETYKGKKCISKSELKEINSETVIIIESLYYFEIKRQLENEGYFNIRRIFYEKIAGEEYLNNNRDEVIRKISLVKSLLADDKSIIVYDRLLSAYDQEDLPDDYFVSIQDKDQYFDDGLIHFSDDEVFVDLGAYIGDSAENFIKHVDGKYEKLHLFELDPEVYRRLMLNVADLYESTKKGIIQCYPYGASENTAEIEFSAGDSSSKIMDTVSGENLVKGTVKALDEVLLGERITFIKADIEGAELGALKGAKKVIEKNRPTLAFCIYHSLADTVDIPIWIHENFPDYKLYVRHYTDLMLETVCYAIK